MGSLDKDVMYYFRDEMEKQAIIVKALVGAGKLVASAAKGAHRGVTSYMKNMSRLSALGNQTRTKALKDGTEKLLTNKDIYSARHLMGGLALGATGLYAGKKGLEAYKTSRQKQKQLPLPKQSGTINLNQY